jgi:hypothetical protein
MHRKTRKRLSINMLYSLQYCITILHYCTAVHLRHFIFLQDNAYDILEALLTLVTYRILQLQYDR